MFLAVVLRYVIVRGAAQLKSLVRVGSSGAGTLALVVATIALVRLVLSVSGRA